MPWNCPNQEKQTEMIEKIGTMDQECKEWKSIMLFEDAVHQLHTTNIGYAIQRRWKKHTKILPTNTWRNRFTVLWAINPHNWDFISVETKAMCNMELAKLLIDKIVSFYKNEINAWVKIYMILDNARYQKAYDVQNYAKDNDIILQFLPAYCPHLNIIERVRKWLKNKLKNNYIEHSRLLWKCSKMAMKDKRKLSRSFRHTIPKFPHYLVSLL